MPISLWISGIKCKNQMIEFPNKLTHQLEQIRSIHQFRELNDHIGLIDFSSNDYLGYSRNKTIFKHALELLDSHDLNHNGSSGSRLIHGNHMFFNVLEKHLCLFHEAEACIIFNSGFDANLGFFSSIPQRGDLIFYDESIHASLRDGIRLSYAKSHRLYHNDLSHLKKCLEEFSDHQGEKYVVVESIYSMNGDSPQLENYCDVCEEYEVKLVIDEAHATGFFGQKGQGLVQALGLNDQIFARIHTFGKAIGVHGACILGSNLLKNYLVNFCRSFIYTTALPPHTVATVLSTYQYLEGTSDNDNFAPKILKNLISFFRREIISRELTQFILPRNSPIQSVRISGNKEAKTLAHSLQKKGLGVKEILAPTVPKGTERIRIALHSFNSNEEIDYLLTEIRKQVLN